jgi:dTDP-4-dehydrorhamnose 3,5-epimerase
MIFTPTNLSGSFTIELKPFSDNRGWFSRTFCKQTFEQIGHHSEWVQMNHSVTFKKGTVRGMHYQLPPFSEIKMVRCIVGAIYDVIVDIRANSPTYLQWFGTELSADNKKMMYIPEGFAHGFQTVTDDCELIYHHSNFYTPNSEGGLKFNDKSINIDWPLAITEISERDNSHPLIDANFKGI